MRNKTHTFIVLLLLSNIFWAQQKAKEFPVITGPYLGQKLPGLSPELFAPGIVAVGYQEQKIAISSDGTEIFYSIVQSNSPQLQIMQTKLKGGVWTKPQIASFSNEGINFHPAFSPDGKKLFFVSTRKGDKSNPNHSMDIWYVEKKSDGWTEPVNLGGNINSERHEACPSLMADGTLFFETNQGPDQKDWNVYVSYCKNGIYQKAEKVPSPISTENNEGGPFIAPDGNYLLFFSNRAGTLGNVDLYITYKKKDGTWGDAFNLGEKINSKDIDRTASVSPDGKYLFFHSSRSSQPISLSDYDYAEELKKNFGLPKPENGTLYWVSAKIIEDLRPNK